jgi:addiction module RelE/StbE family toxin
MRLIKLTKQARKKLQTIQKSHPKIAKTISAIILGLKEDVDMVNGEMLQGYSEFKKVRVSKYRIIYTYDAESVTITKLINQITIYPIRVDLLPM